MGIPGMGMEEAARGKMTETVPAGSGSGGEERGAAPGLMRVMLLVRTEAMSAGKGLGRERRRRQ